MVLLFSEFADATDVSLVSGQKRSGSKLGSDLRGRGDFCQNLGQNMPDSNSLKNKFSRKRILGQTYVQDDSTL